eukprot:scpid92294/ scgid5367/ 
MAVMNTILSRTSQALASTLLVAMAAAMAASQEVPTTGGPTYTSTETVNETESSLLGSFCFNVRCLSGGNCSNINDSIISLECVEGYTGPLCDLFIVGNDVAIDTASISAMHPYIPTPQPASDSGGLTQAEVERWRGEFSSWQHTFNLWRDNALAQLCPQTSPPYTANPYSTQATPPYTTNQSPTYNPGHLPTGSPSQYPSSQPPSQPSTSQPHMYAP